MKNSRREVFIPLVVSFPNLGDKLCFVRDILSKFLHGVVNPRTFFRVLENSVIEQSQLRAEILKGDVGDLAAFALHADCADRCCSPLGLPREPWKPARRYDLSATVRIF